MIAIIDSTYAEENKVKEANLYKNKAELNQECFEILKYLKRAKEFRIVIFSKFEMNDKKEISKMKMQGVRHGIDDETESLMEQLDIGVDKQLRTSKEKLKIL